MQSQRPVLRQVQKLKMTPQLYQAVRLMALPLQDLKTTIEEELEKNPALQVEEDRSTVSLDSLPARESGDGEGDWFDHTSDAGYSRADGEAASDARRQFIEGALSLPESLQEHLLAQLALQPIPEDWLRIGELLIRNLDENGFHKEPPEILLQKTRTRSCFPKVLELVQGFDPVGTCVKDVRESLLVQIRKHPRPHPRAAELVESWLEALEKQRLREIEKGMRISEAALKEIVAFIRTLDPLPGRNFSRDVVRYVLPDVQVVLQDGEFVIVLNDEMIPVLGINPLFAEMARRKGEAKDPEDPAVRHAEPPGCALVHPHHRPEKRDAPEGLPRHRGVPAGVLPQGPEVHAAAHAEGRGRRRSGCTRPRCPASPPSKYIQTEWGIFALKHFFSNSVAATGSAGSRFSKEGVKEIIREIIEQERRRGTQGAGSGARRARGGRGLSDQKIVEILAAKGYLLARRTVAKYRGELAIESSYQRRRT